MNIGVLICASVGAAALAVSALTQLIVGRQIHRELQSQGEKLKSIAARLRGLEDGIGRISKRSRLPDCETESRNA